ncbi:ester cyclase [Haladaptatus sp. CMSO5]|uniref:ester cyclase n=1 Tax=Haladaptatus sp. CMSO5 TaxID=3120514 RepID=UPI002FCE1110
MATTSGQITEQNKRLAREYLEAVENHTDGRIENLTDLVAADVVNHTPVSRDELTPGEERGIDLFRKHTEAVTRGFSDVHFDIHDMLAEDDRVLVRFDVVGTHDGMFMGVEPTGKPVRISTFGLYRFDDGKLVERWSESDLVSFLSQVGAIDL